VNLVPNLGREFSKGKHEKCKNSKAGFLIVSRFSADIFSIEIAATVVLSLSGPTKEVIRLH
jgi:hypothetical protein